MTIEFLKENNLIIFEGIVGSKAYGTNTPTSDTDIKGVFVLPTDYILGINYIEQVSDEKNDTTYFEIRRFLELLQTNNPTVLELLNLPEDCILYKDPIFDLILDNKDKFITKKCGLSFGGYAIGQITKAKGQDKKQNWENDKVTRKDVLDFVYVIEGEKSIPWKIWNSNGIRKAYEEKFCGVVNINNARDLYAVYFDKTAYSCFSELMPEEIREYQKKFCVDNNKPMGLGYKGIVKSGEGVSKSESNQLRLSSIPKGETPICIISYNKDSYTSHCIQYRSYETWLEKRNIHRWVDVKSHGQKIDGKNMMHCRRMMDMAREIAEGKGIIVRRPNVDELLSIRRGEVDLQTLIDHVQSEIGEIDRLFKESNLPDNISNEFINDILIKIRKNSI